MTQPSAAPKKQGMSPLAIVLIVLGSIFLVCVGTCAVGFFWLKGKAEGVMGELSDGGGGMVIASPPEVKAALAGPKKDYVGHWEGDNGSELVIDAAGNLNFQKRSASGTNENYNVAIAAFAGNDIELKVFVKVTIRVTKAPRKVGDHWEMTADGISLSRK
jgi:hypothetical protein